MIRLHATLGRLTLGRLTLVLLAFTQLGCGYGLVGRGTNIPDHVQRVYLTPLENATRRSEVDQILTRALAEEMVARRRFTLVNEVGQSDAVLAGQVILFDVTPLSFDDEGRATEYQITITVGMSFRDRAADSVLWQNDRYVYKESYQVERPDEPYFDREKLAIESAAGRFARTVLVDLLEGF
jgi:outer membrane lipopolysaccharide assembly protein LptE/RlpB